MKISFYISVAASGLCLLLSIILLVVGNKNQSAQLEVQKQQQELQKQQEQLNIANQISQQVGLVRSGDPSTLAVVFWAAVHGAVSLEISGAASPETQHDETYAAVLDTIERGLAP